MKSTFGKVNKNKASISDLVTLVWCGIFTWVCVILYFWFSGFLHTSNSSTLLYVDRILNRTENSLRKAENILIKDFKNVENVLVQDLKRIHIHKISEMDFSPEAYTYASMLHQANYNRGKRYDIHAVFSTDCSAYQDWQSLVLFYTATIVKQKGPITRIASGCGEAKKLELTAMYAKLWPHYYVHFTPDFKYMEGSNKKYDFYNKPRGLKHWLANADPPVQDDSIVALIDPDFLFLRPLTVQVKDNPRNIYDKALASEIFDVISENHPVAQMYGLGAPWTNNRNKKFNRTAICGEGSPCLVPTMEYADLHFAVGPPYLVHKRDMNRIADTWTTFVPRVYKGYPFLLAEMYAYSMAAAHEKLPHFQMEQHMVSNINTGGEGWKFIDMLDDPCQTPTHTSYNKGMFFLNYNLPTFLHYCQNYEMGGIGFSKKRVSKNMFSCDSPLLKEIPDNYYSDALVGNQRTDILTKRSAFMICTIHRSINAALVDYKKRMCHGRNVNYNATKSF